MRTAFTLIGAVLLLAGCQRPSNPATEIDVSKVTTVRARIVHNPDEGPLVDWYEAAPTDIPHLVELFKDGVAEPYGTANWLRFGDIEIVTNDGKTFGIEIFWTGQKRGAYRIGGRWVRGGSDRAFRDGITDCAKRGKRL